MTATKSTDIQRFINLLLLLTGAKDAKSQENVASILHFCLLFYQKEHRTLHPPEFDKGLSLGAVTFFRFFVTQLY
jgi:hypothetical protein